MLFYQQKNLIHIANNKVYTENNLYNMKLTIALVDLVIMSYYSLNFIHVSLLHLRQELLSLILNQSPND